MLTFASGAGALMMKFVAEPILRRFGFRGTLIVNALLAAVFIFAPAFFTPQTSWLVMLVVLFVGGLSRSLQFTALNAIAYADVPSGRLTSATSFTSVERQLAGSLGISIAALGLESMQHLTGGPALQVGHFPVVFGLVAAISLIAAIPFARLSRQAGAEMLVRP
jgi:MFS family permease